MIAAEVSARDAVVRNNAKLANQINPNVAEGTFFDAIWALTAGQRTVSTFSTAVCTLTGVPGSIISTSVRFRSENGDIWAVTAPVTLDVTGVATVTVRCTVAGPVGAAANTINQILVGSLGLETVTNPDPATVGSLTESDLSARKQRKNTIGLQGSTLPVAIISALYALPNVRSLAFRENYTNAPITIDSVTLVPHSIYVCIDGGLDLDIATTLLGKKSLGANWNGTTTVTVTDPSSGQPYPVKFSRPTDVNLLIRVTTVGSPPLVDPQTAVREAILAYQDGLIENEDGFTVGGDVSPFELAGAINRLYPAIYVKKVEVAVLPSGSYSTDVVPILISQRARVQPSAIQVLVE